MKHSFRCMAAAVAALAACASFSAGAADEAKAPTAMVVVYHIAPGKHLDFLNWQAARDAIDKEVGIAPTQFYAHRSGDSWDYVSIGPMTTPEQDAAADAAAKKKGLTSGFKASLEFRTFVASHSDTVAEGPVTAAQLVSEAQ